MQSGFDTIEKRYGVAFMYDRYCGSHRANALNGFLIPFNRFLKKIKRDKILLEVQVIEDDKLEKGYAILDELVGFCESDRTDASLNHDKIIYNLPTVLS